MTRGSYPYLKWTPEMVARFWDWQSQFPETYFTYQFGGAIAGIAAKHLAGRDAILDYGCGTGYLLDHLCRMGKRVYGADLSPKSVDSVNARMKGKGNFVEALTTDRIKDENRRFDAIVAVELIEHLYDEHLEGVLADLKAMLNDGGIVIITTPNDEDLEKSMILSPESGQLFHRWQHVRSWSAESLTAHLEKAGFRVIETTKTNFANQRPTAPVKLAKWLVKQVLFDIPADPHLMCVATLK